VDFYLKVAIPNICGAPSVAGLRCAATGSTVVGLCVVLRWRWRVTACVFLRCWSLQKRNDMRSLFLPTLAKVRKLSLTISSILISVNDLIKFVM